MKRKLIISFIIVSALAAAAAPVAHVYATDSNWNNFIYPRVYIKNLDLSGKTLEEAKKILEEHYQKPILSKKIEVTAGNKTYTLDYGQLDATYNIDEVVKEAFKYGKEENILGRYELIKGTSRRDFILSFSYDSKPIEDLIDEIEKEINKDPENAKISINKGKINITPSVNGVRLQREVLRKAILEKINDELSEDKLVIEAPIEPIEAQLTTEDLNKINTTISSFHTNFSTSTENRINNIELAAKAINGTLLMPGEEFSFNETVGERTKARGYKEAGVIIGDRIESGLGGGICQVSSTLYRAVLQTNIKVDERQNHTLPLGYIGKGLDATVDWGNIDFKFTNTLNYPVYIEAYTESKNVYFKIYSNSELTKQRYDISTEVYEVVKPTIKYTNTDTLYEGETKVVKQGSQGYKVRVYRKTYEGDKLIDTEVISNDYYRPVNAEALMGTMKKELK